MRLKRRSQNQNSEMETQKLIKQLASLKEKKREQAKKRLIEIGADAVEPLMRTLNMEQAQYKVRNRLGYILPAAGLLYCIGSFFAWLPHIPLLFPLCALYGLMGWAFRVTKRFHSLVFDTLVEIGDKRMLPVLIRELYSDDNSMRRHTERAMLPLLSTLDEADAQLLDISQRHILYSHLSILLKPYKILVIDERFAIAAINALQYLGDENAMGVLKRLASRPNRYKSAAIRQAAAETIIKLQARLEREKQPQYLLRAAKVNDEIDTLLRPADSITIQDNQQLLRSSRDEE